MSWPWDWRRASTAFVFVYGVAGALPACSNRPPTQSAPLVVPVGDPANAGRAGDPPSAVPATAAGTSGEVGGASVSRMSVPPSPEVGAVSVAAPRATGDMGAAGGAVPNASSTGGSGAGSTPDSGSAARLAVQHCDAARAGFAYRAGSASSRLAAQPPAARAPIPCATYTDLGSTEASLGILKDGSVLFAPAYQNDGVGLLRSADSGETWEFVTPKLANGGSHGRMQPYLYVDPSTDRIFFASTASNAPMPVYDNGFDLSISSDGGRTFSSVNLAPDAFDWVKIFAGPPVHSKTSGYPNIVYASAPSPISTPIPIASLAGLAPQYQSINRSLDGGMTWERVAMPSLLASDVPGCAAANEWVIYGAGAVAADGTAYLVLRHCRKLAVAVSADEGLSWAIHELPDAPLPPFDTTNLLEIVANPNLLVTEQLALDSEGNVYAAWIDDKGSLRLSISRDKAQTWSASVVVAAPEVTDVRYAGLATRQPGTLAIAYYGSRDGVHYNGYVTETTNAFDAEPVFASVLINDPDDPLYPWGFEVGYMGITSGADLNEIVQVKYAPNGDLWASFVKDMCESATTTRCHWDVKAHANSPYQGVVARMVHDASTRWSEPRAVDPDRFKTTCEQGAASAMACNAIASSENICEELASCACGHCACSMLDCRKDKDCDAVRQCATKNNCRGIDCILTCQDVALESGELMTTRALRVASCLSVNSCPSSCPAF